jgi:hypothetical protein
MDIMPPPEKLISTHQRSYNPNLYATSNIFNLHCDDTKEAKECFDQNSKEASAVYENESYFFKLDPSQNPRLISPPPSPTEYEENLGVEVNSCLAHIIVPTDNVEHSDETVASTVDSLHMHMDEIQSTQGDIERAVTMPSFSESDSPSDDRPRRRSRSKGHQMQKDDAYMVGDRTMFFCHIEGILFL